MTINEIAKEIHENAVEHGWWDGGKRPIPEVIALCHSELSEALEAYRKDEPLCWYRDGKPDGIAIEMVDCVIRIFDYLASEDLDVEYLIAIKNKYNKERSYRHGNKRC